VSGALGITTARVGCLPSLASDRIDRLCAEAVAVSSTYHGSWRVFAFREGQYLTCGWRGTAARYSICAPVVPRPHRVRLVADGVFCVVVENGPDTVTGIEVLPRWATSPHDKRAALR